MCGIGLCVMYGSPGMLGRCIDGRELQGAIPGIENIVPCAPRHKDGIPCVKTALKICIFLARSHADKRLSPFHADELIRVGVHFQTNLAADRDVH